MPRLENPDLLNLVGVTGHRDILAASMPQVRDALRGALVALRGALGPTLTLVTALAEGGDQLTAEIARELGIKMIAISPMPLARYRETMESATGIETFERLWNDNLVLQRLELPLAGGCDPACQDATQYERLGQLLSERSHILLALWNGHDPEPESGRAGRERQTRGGTAHVVAMRQARDGGLPILQLATPRRKDGGKFCQDASSNAWPPGTLLWWPEPGAAAWRRLDSASLRAAVPAAMLRIQAAPGPSGSVI